MNSNDNSILSFVLLGFLGFWFFGSTSDKTCRSHDRFSFYCHHNDSNTDIYLRRIIVNQEKIIKQIDKTPENIKTRNEVKENALYSEFIVDAMLDQLRLLRSGRVHTGFWSLFIPNFLRSEEDKEFDFHTDKIVAFFTENKNYTREEAEIFRKATVVERSFHPTALEHCILDKIKSNLRNIIEADNLRMIIKEHNNTTPENLWSLLYSQRDDSKIDAAISKAMEAIKAGKINNFNALEKLICKTSSIWMDYWY